MSGVTSTGICPNCKGETLEYEDWKPVSYNTITCYNCGFQMFPQFRYMSFRELNLERADKEMPPLEKRPKRRPLDEIT